MLNEKKIHVMAKLAMMEEDKEKFEIKDYYMGDYIRFQLMKTIVRVTVGYLLVLGLIAVYNAEFLINNTVGLDYGRIGMYVALIYVLLLFVYIIGGLLVYSYRYRRAQRYINKYEKGLAILHRFYQNGSEHK